MGKKKCWFSWLKKIFDSDANPKTEKKSERRKWIFGRLRLEQYHPVLAASPPVQEPLHEATEEQRKHALTVAIATAAAAEAAVAAAQAAAEVVRLAGATDSFHHFATRDENRAAAIKIQTAFRAHLARKALRAQKRLAKLQVIVRDQIARRRAMKNTTCSQSGTKMYPEIKDSISTTKVMCPHTWRNQSHIYKDELQAKDIIKHEYYSQRSWNASVASKDDAEAIRSRRKEAMTKRDRMKKYSYSHREGANVHKLDESVHVKENRRRSFVEAESNATEENRRERLMTLKHNVASNSSNTQVNGLPRIRFTNSQKQNMLDGSNSPFSFPRRSFCRVQQSPTGDGLSSVPWSPVFPTYMAATESAKAMFPTYMAATESAKAKTRSMSTPRQRLGLSETCFDHGMPYKDAVSLWSTYNGETFSINGKK